jgi:hypothetical protein
MLKVVFAHGRSATNEERGGGGGTNTHHQKLAVTVQET